MISFLIVGLSIGVLARALRSGPGRPQVMVTLPVAVVSALVGGVVANVVQDQPLAHSGFISVCAALVVTLIGVGILEVTHPTRG